MKAPGAIHFLGVGNAQAVALGASACVLEREGAPMLLIDCGPEIPNAYAEAYHGALPEALFITHAHLDHIGGLERLFFRAWFEPQARGRIRLFVPVRLVETLQRRLADYPGLLAEGGANFWDAFHLVPVTDHFWLAGLRFAVFPVRHHGFLSAYGLALPGAFLFTGDTLPVPEVINAFAAHGEVIFHDCCLGPNAAHTALGTLAHHYRPEQLQRMVFYHVESEQAARTIEALGYQVARRGERIPLTEPVVPGAGGARDSA